MEKGRKKVKEEERIVVKKSYKERNTKKEWKERSHRKKKMIKNE